MAEGVAGTATLTATVSGTALTTVGRLQIVTNGTAISGQDYSLSSDTITIPTGATSANITISVIDDNFFEGKEFASFSIGETVGGLTGAAGATGLVIVNNDVTNTVVNAVTGHTKIINGLAGFSDANLIDEEFFAISVVNIGDVDGDGVTDIAVGATDDEAVDGVDNEE